MSEYIKCEICGNEYMTLARHLRTHNIDVYQYQRKFPGMPTVSIECSNRISTTLRQNNIQDPTINERRSQTMKKAWADPDVRKGICESHDIYWQDPKHHQELSQSVTKMWTRSGHREKTIASQLKRWEDPEVHKSVKAALNLYWSDSKHHEELSKAVLAAYASNPGYGQKISESSLRMWQNPKIRNQIIEAQSKRAKALWRNPEFVTKAILSWSRGPNGSELRLKTILNKHFPNTFEFVGDCIRGYINGRVADFKDIQNKHIVIEMFGLFWHDPIYHPERPTEEELIAHYKRNGYTCLVFWEDVVWCDEQQIVDRVSEVLK